MICVVQAGKQNIEYELLYKKVKNINMRIHADGRITVSANRYVSKKQIEDFVRAKADFIRKAKADFASRQSLPKTKYFEADELIQTVQSLCEKVYPYYAEKGVSYPKIKFRQMTSRWGSCHTQKGVLTFNLNLMYAPYECVLYVILHEFTHFLQPNHSPLFYQELEKVCPTWKMQKTILKGIKI
ncbi:MAG: DUF45 domain-containing protein [Clostridia bacterium]|nr:DUF45 domain-containing protein [Clostridia bacterium]